VAGEIGSTGAAQKSLLGKADQYNLNQWDKADCVSNGWQKSKHRHIVRTSHQPFVIGRKNLAVCQYRQMAKSQCYFNASSKNRQSDGLIPYDLPRETASTNCQNGRAPTALDSCCHGNISAYLGG